MIKEEEKKEDFFFLAKIFQFIFFETFNFISFFAQRLQSSEVGPFCLFLPIFDHFKPTLEGCSVWLKKDTKNLNTYLKSAKFKISEQYKLKYFSQVEKIFIFFFFIFHFHFRVFWKFLQLYILPLRIIFSTRYYF